MEEELGQTTSIKGAVDLRSGDEIDMVLFQYLASGSFGTVMLGELSKRKGGGRKQVNCPAAVKILRQSSPKGQNEEESSPLIYEANILSVSPLETLNRHREVILYSVTCRDCRRRNRMTLFFTKYVADRLDDAGTLYS